jgi:multidrug resistance efflux pump
MAFLVRVQEREQALARAQQTVEFERRGRLADVREATNRIDRLEALVASRFEDIDRLRRELDKARTDVPTLESEIAALRSELTGVRLQLDDHGVVGKKAKNDEPEQSEKAET